MHFEAKTSCSDSAHSIHAKKLVRHCESHAYVHQVFLNCLHLISCYSSVKMFHNLLALNNMVSVNRLFRYRVCVCVQYFYMMPGSALVCSVAKATPHCAVLQNHVQACWGRDKAMSLKNFISLSHTLVDSIVHCLFTKPIATKKTAVSRATTTHKALN